MMETKKAENKQLNRELMEQELDTVYGGNLVRVNQYHVQPGKAYWIDFPCVLDVIIPRPYGDKSGKRFHIQVYKVYEAKRTFGWGTNRTIDGIDIDSGEYVTVAINHDNVYIEEELAHRF